MLSRRVPAKMSATPSEVLLKSDPSFILLRWWLTHHIMDKRCNYRLTVVNSVDPTPGRQLTASTLGEGST